MEQSTPQSLGNLVVFVFSKQPLHSQHNLAHRVLRVGQLIDKNQIHSAAAQFFLDNPQVGILSAQSVGFQAQDALKKSTRRQVA